MWVRSHLGHDDLTALCDCGAGVNSPSGSVGRRGRTSLSEADGRCGVTGLTCCPDCGTACHPTLGYRERFNPRGSARCSGLRCLTDLAHHDEPERLHHSFASPVLSVTASRSCELSWRPYRTGGWEDRAYSAS